MLYTMEIRILYIMRKKHWDVLEKVSLVGGTLCQGKNDYEIGISFYGLFLAPKKKHCLTLYEFGIKGEHATFEGFKDSKRPIDRSQKFKMVEGKKKQLCYSKVGKKFSIVELS